MGAAPLQQAEELKYHWAVDQERMVWETPWETPEARIVKELGVIEERLKRALCRELVYGIESLLRGYVDSPFLRVYGASLLSRGYGASSAIQPTSSPAVVSGLVPTRTVGLVPRCSVWGGRYAPR